MKLNHPLLDVPVSLSTLRGLVLCALIGAGALGCAREAAPGTTPAAEPAAGTGAGDEGATPPTEGTAEPGDQSGLASGGQADAPTDSTATEPAADAPVEPVDDEPPVVVDMTPAAAPTICAALVDEPESVRRCAFLRGGVSLPGGARADVLELAYDSVEVGEVFEAYLVVRMPNEEFPVTRQLGERTDVPGMSTDYTLGRLERTPSGVRIRVTNTDTTYPDTGMPGPGRAEVERARLVVTCTLDAETQYYDCERD